MDFQGSFSYLNHLLWLALNVVELKTLKLMLYHDTFLEAKKGRTGGHSKSVMRMPPDESVFVQFLREAGITLKQDKASNEIGKTHICYMNTCVAVKSLCGDTNDVNLFTF